MTAYLQELAASFTNPVTAIAQILGLIPVVLGFFIFRNINRTTSITIKAASDFLSAVHFLLLGAPTGCAINFVNTLRGICFAQKGRKQWASGIWMPILFCAATMVSTLIGWSGHISLLPMAGSCLAVVGYWCTEPRHLRRFNFAGIFLWTVYGVITLSVPTMVGNAISLTSIVLTEIRTARKKTAQ